MPKLIKLSASSIRQFLNCRRRWWFEYVEGLEPLVKPEPLTMGAAIHAGLEVIAKSRKFVEDEVAKAIRGEFSQDELDASGVNPDVAFLCCKAYMASDHWKEWRFLSVEPWFEVPIGHGRRLRGRFDGIIEWRGSIFVLERKTVPGTVSERTLHHLLWDDQAGVYALAARELGLDVKGILYEYIPKPTIEPDLATPIEFRKYTLPKYAKHEACKGKGCGDCGLDGAPVGKVLTEGPRLYANMRDRDETKPEYLARVETWYAENREAFITHPVLRNQAQMERMVEHIKSVASDIRSCETTGAYYMNPSACSVLPCPFQGICLEDTPEARAGNFKVEE